ncbi:sensor domain-containing protein [Algibacillus agarilyticus]|uniref:sensor domain-containing protein n=1 Tax=Algibacillus agarilyticus TaxID=2234133 RepID=UPI000DD05AAF|nr:bifunctional diguanylate cyclase/phosphodiesterase [Algibacillus agarilyticus]
MHSLLARILRKQGHGIKVTPEMAGFLDHISEAFDQADDDRKMLEHSLQLTSNELNDINGKLNNQLEQVKGFQHETENMLIKQKALLDASPEAMFSFNLAGEIVQINQSGCDFFNKEEIEIVAMTGEDVLVMILKKVLEPDEFLAKINPMFNSKHARLHGFINTLDEKTYEYYSVPELAGDRYIGRVWCCRDITNIKRQEALLKYRAYHDTLTDLPNRTFLIETLEKNIILSERNKARMAVIFIDLDDFKKINDTVGHAAGDNFLKTITIKLNRILRKGDVLARIGGDEFVLVLESRNEGELYEEFDTAVKRLLAVFQSPFIVKGKRFVVTCSAGMARFPEDAKQANELIGKADMAMYQAKRQGKNKVVMFDSSLEENIQHRIYNEEKLHHAIKNKEFVLHYQPQIDIKTGNLIGVEALIRWEISHGELIYPDQFIGLAEEMGLISRITELVLETVCERREAWRTIPTLANVPISINLSALDFNNDQFIQNVFEIMGTYNFDSSLLEFELTETAVFDDLEKVRNVLSKLKQHFVKIAIDDFGTGYSSFSYLQDLDIDYLKIDKSFVQDLQQNKRSVAIVKSIIDIGVNLGLTVIAEGVETEEDAAFLKAHGCHIGQGYLYSKPVPEQQLIAYAADLLSLLECDIDNQAKR